LTPTEPIGYLLSMPISAAGRRQKGSRAEREVLTLLRDHLGDHLVRARGEGANDHGDIAGLVACAVQVKNYADTTRAVREGLAGALEQADNAGLAWGAAFIRRRGGRYVVVMAADDWIEMYREAVLAGTVVAGGPKTLTIDYGREVAHGTR
jgi:hypothetical protein